jgi:hypothetical protein
MAEKVPTVTTITSRDERVEVRKVVVDELIREAIAAGLTSDDLDDLVHDCCDQTASSRVNNDPTLIEMDIEAAQDRAYGECGAIGSDVNNRGVEAQIAFLVAELGDINARFRVQERYGAAVA